MIGRIVGSCRIDALLGAGGMGEVYRAYDERLRRIVAIKRVVDPAHADHGAAILREARAASNLSHPHICTIHEVIDSDEESFIVMEYVKGRPLSDVLAGTRLPAETVARYGAQIADALGHAHQRGVIHCDLKAANVVVDADDNVKVLDFGVARVSPAADATTQPSSGASAAPASGGGTLAYLAPEILRGSAPDARSDIWSLGVLLYEMAAGARPFTGDTAPALIAAILEKQPVLSPDSMPAALASVVGKCLARDRSARYKRAEEVRAALDALRAGVPPTAHGPAPIVRTSRRFQVAAATVAVVALGAAVMLSVKPGPAPVGETPISAIAVLPLSPVGTATETAYFAEGMTEALITQLAKVKALRVISRTSAMRYRDSSRTLASIADELRVGAVVEGSVTVAGSSVRVTARLVDVGADRQLWADSYERDLRDVLLLQRDVARAITEGIRVAVTPDERSRMEAAGPLDPEAYQEYVKGRHFWSQRTRAALDIAIGHFDRALSREPRYAAAYAGLADCYVLLPAVGVGAMAPVEGLAKAAEAARRALQLDDTLAEAHTSLAYVQLHTWQWEASAASFARALDLNPSYATARFWHASLLAARGQPEAAIAEARRAVDLDPVSPIINAGLAWMYHLARRFDDELAQARRTLDVQTGFPIGFLRLGSAATHLGRHREAVDAFRAGLSASGDSPDYLALLGFALARAGDLKEARQVVAQLEARARRSYVPAYDLALVHAGLGDSDATMRWLERAYAERSWALAHIAVEPDLDGVRDHPRFRQMVERIHAGGTR